jgi:hypothetical protein
MAKHPSPRRCSRLGLNPLRRCVRYAWAFSLACFVACSPGRSATTSTLRNQIEVRSIASVGAFAPDTRSGADVLEAAASLDDRTQSGPRDSPPPGRVCDEDCQLSLDDCQSLTDQGTSATWNRSVRPWFRGSRRLRWPTGGVVSGWLRLRTLRRSVCVAAVFTFAGNVDTAGIDTGILMCDGRERRIGVNGNLSPYRDGLRLTALSAWVPGVLRPASVADVTVVWRRSRFVVTGGGDVQFAGSTVLSLRPWYRSESECDAATLR